MATYVQQEWVVKFRNPTRKPETIKVPMGLARTAALAYAGIAPFEVERATRGRVVRSEQP